jgi:hypothetical protein
MAALLRRDDAVLQHRADALVHRVARKDERWVMRVQPVVEEVDFMV